MLSVLFPTHRPGRPAGEAVAAGASRVRAPAAGLARIVRLEGEGGTGRGQKIKRGLDEGKQMIAVLVFFFLHMKIGCLSSIHERYGGRGREGRGEGGDGHGGGGGWHWGGDGHCLNTELLTTYRKTAFIKFISRGICTLG